MNENSEMVFFFGMIPKVQVGNLVLLIDFARSLLERMSSFQCETQKMSKQKHIK